MWVVSKCSSASYLFIYFFHFSSRHAFLYITADHRLNYRTHPLFFLVYDFQTARENMQTVKSALQCVSCLLFIFCLNPWPLVFHNHHQNLPDYCFSTPTHLSAPPLPISSYSSLQRCQKYMYFGNNSVIIYRLNVFIDSLRQAAVFKCLCVIVK